MSRSIEVVLSPDLFHLKRTKEPHLTIVIDVLRATTSICTLFEKGVHAVIPVATLDELKEMKDKGLLVAAERNAVKVDFADFGNSPMEFMQADLFGKTIAYSTTNGTQTIYRVKDAGPLALASFLNLHMVADWINNKHEQVVICCSGWKGRFCMEDTICAGALLEMLLQNDKYISDCDAVLMALQLWRNTRNDLLQILHKSSAYNRLQKAGLHDIMEFTLKQNIFNVLPVLKEGVLLNETGK